MKRMIDRWCGSECDGVVFKSCTFGLLFGVFGLNEFVAQHTLPCHASCRCALNEVHVEDWPGLSIGLTSVAKNTKRMEVKKWDLEKRLERQEVLDVALVTRNKHSMNSLVSHNAVKTRQKN